TRSFSAVITAYRKTSFHRDKPNCGRGCKHADPKLGPPPPSISHEMLRHNGPCGRRGQASGVSGISLLHDVKKTAALCASGTRSLRCRTHHTARAQVWWSQTG